MIKMYLFLNTKTGDMRISPINDMSSDEHLQLETISSNYDIALNSCKMYALGLIHGQVQYSRGFHITAKEENFQ